ncbi:MAG TPA: M20/M25/M40 family metallo-hydrolase [Terriglobales bacterium]|nr:M20/M25/M40 family metallo-hydrolase [Terriglobales bacterium]
MKKFCARVVVFLLIATGLLLSQTSSDSERIITEALKQSSLEANLRRLTDQVGGRVPGTPAMRHGVEWGLAAFTAVGGKNVHTEEFTVPHSWAEGATQMRVVAPEQFTVHAISLGWAPALSPHAQVQIVDVGQGTPDDFAKAGRIAGAVLLVHTEEMKTWEDLFAEYLNAPGIVERAVKGKALAIAFQSTRPNDLLYRHTNAVAGEIDRVPMVLVTREDGSRMGRLLASGQSLYADLAIPNQIGGAIKAANVIAEIPGSEQPDQFVLLGAHLDSWELGTGALDNGCNAALVVDALRAIKDSGLRPRHTIRFALFSGEEEGMLGSRAYVTVHRSELDKAVGVVIFDSGTGRTTGFSLGGRKDVAAATTSLIEPLQEFGAANVTTDAEWGTDNFDFMLEGVPTFVANQEEANYLINYHAQSDTFDKVDLTQLKKHVAEAAELTFALANAPQRVGPRLDRAAIEQTMRDTGLDKQLRVMGVWQEWERGQRGRMK